MPAIGAQTTHAQRLARITELSDGIRGRARDIDERGVFPAETFAELRAAGLLSLTAPAGSAAPGCGRRVATGPTTSCSRRSPGSTAVTAQLLQVHSHALGIVSGLAGEAQREILLPEIVSAGKLLASVGSEAKPSGKLADIARTELERAAAAASGSPVGSTSRRSRRPPTSC